MYMRVGALMPGASDVYCRQSVTASAPHFFSCSGTVVVEAYWFGGKGLVCNERCSRYQSKPGPPLAPFSPFAVDSGTRTPA